MSKVILLLEDDERLAGSIVGALELRGHTVSHARTVAEARELYDVDVFHVLLCDYQLPDGTGIDFLSGVRGSDGAKTILWSGLDRSAEVAASGMHVDHVLLKDSTVAALDVIEAS